MEINNIKNMQPITSVERLKNTIQLLEVEQAISWQLVNDQFKITYESLRPVNIIKNTVKDIVKSPDILTNILGAVVGMGTGYLSKKIVVGASSNIVRNILGSLLQVGVSNSVANHPDAIKSVGQYIFNHFLRKKEKKEQTEND